METRKNKSQRGPHSKPALCPAIFFSEKIIREAGTGKLSVINSFQSFNGPQFPFAAPPFIVTASFSNLSGKLDRLKASVEVLDADAKALGPPITGEFGSDREVVPDDIFDLSFLVPSCSFEKEGVYQVLFRIGDDLLGQRGLPARLIPRPEAAPEAAAIADVAVNSSEPSQPSEQKAKPKKKPGEMTKHE
jgi:hypothetical protein